MHDIPFNDYYPSANQRRQAQMLIELLQECDEQGIMISVFGGYGLDALYGQLTRDHGDFDLFAAPEAHPHLFGVLAAQGYRHVPEWREEGFKEVFIHPTVDAPFKVDIAPLNRTILARIAQQIGMELDIRMYFPEQPNGQLLGYSMRVPTLAGVESIDYAQTRRHTARGSAEYAYRAHQTQLMTLLRER
jgi:hypothetical protein